MYDNEISLNCHSKYIYADEDDLGKGGDEESLKKKGWMWCNRTTKKC